MKNATERVYSVNSGPKVSVPWVASMSAAHRPAAIMKPPASKWQMLNVICAGTQRSAMMPMRAGINMDTRPCTV